MEDLAQAILTQTEPVLPLKACFAQLSKQRKKKTTLESPFVKVLLNA